MKKKMYIVKREVFATDIKQAMTAKGRIYEITIADEKYQPTNEKEIKGFNKQK